MKTKNIKIKFLKNIVLSLFNLFLAIKQTRNPKNEKEKIKTNLKKIVPFVIQHFPSNQTNPTSDNVKIILKNELKFKKSVPFVLRHFHSNSQTYPNPETKNKIKSVQIFSNFYCYDIFSATKQLKKKKKNQSKDKTGELTTGDYLALGGHRNRRRN